MAVGYHFVFAWWAGISTPSDNFTGWVTWEFRLFEEKNNTGPSLQHQPNSSAKKINFGAQNLVFFKALMKRNILLKSNIWVCVSIIFIEAVKNILLYFYSLNIFHKNQESCFTSHFENRMEAAGVPLPPSACPLTTHCGLCHTPPWPVPHSPVACASLSRGLCLTLPWPMPHAP